MFIEPCATMGVQSLKSKQFILRVRADYSTVIYKKSLIFKSVGHVQRFPLHLYTDSQVLDVANNLKGASNNNHSLSVFIIVLSLTFVGELLRQNIKSKYQKKIVAPTTNPNPSIVETSVTVPE